MFLNDSNLSDGVLFLTDSCGRGRGGLTMTCWSEGMNSRAFWMTLQPYICRARDSTWPRILSARASFWSRLPN